MGDPSSRCLPTVYARRAFRDSGGLYSVLVPLHVDSSHWWEPGHYLGTAVEQHFMVTQNRGMGSTIGVVLMVLMVLVMYLTRDRKDKGAMTHE